MFFKLVNCSVSNLGPFDHASIVAVETGEEPIPRRGEKFLRLAARPVSRPAAKTGVSTRPTVIEVMVLVT